MRELLFEKYCLGTLAPDEARELKQGLSGDRAIREAMARYLRERSILVHLTGRKTGVTKPHSHPRRAASGSRLWIGVAAACLLIGLALFAVLPTSEPPTLRYERPTFAVNEPVKESPPASPVVEPPPRSVAPKREEPPVVFEIPRREKPAPLPEAKPQPEPPKEMERPAPRATVVAVATVERAAEATVKPGQDILPGNSLKTGSRGSALLRCPDGTRLEIGAATTILDFDPTRGLRVALTEGTIIADVAKRPSGQPLIVATPLGEATVLGTSFKITAGASTRLEVAEGKVRLTRLRDGKSVDVGMQQYAVISSDDELVVRSMLKTVITEEFDRMPAWSSTYDAKWGGPAAWSLGGNALQASRPGKGSSVLALVYTIPAGETLDLSVMMKCPRLAGRQWVEFGYRLGEHKASDFDITPDKWTVVRKFDGDDGPNGNGNVWTRYAASVETGTFIRITVACKVGSFQGSVPSVGWDGVKISSPSANPRK